MRSGLANAAKSTSRYLSYASTSQVTYCPQPIQAWRQELASPMPSSRKILNSLYTAMQSPFPPMQEKQAWIQAQAVEESLRLVFSKGPRVEAERDMLDLVVVGLQRCYKDALKRVEHHIEKQSEKVEICLSEKEKKQMIYRHTDVTAWRRVIKSHNLLYNRLRMGSETRRKPHLEDLRDCLRLTLHSEQPSIVHYHQLLRLIIKVFPLSSQQNESDLHLTRSRLSDTQLRLQLQKGEGNSDSPVEAQALFDRILDAKKDISPRHHKELFEVIWNRMTNKFGLDSTSLHLAFTMETILAAWRLSLSKYEGDPFEPVRLLMGRIGKSRLMDTKHVNTLLWAALRHRPNNANEIGWPSVDDCIALYEEMRANVLWIEMEYERGETGASSFIPGTIAQNPSRLRDAFGLKMGLPVHVIPDRVTYDILIRGLAWQGNLQKATQILIEMTKSPTDTFARWKEIKAGKVRNVSAETDCISPTYEATISTFDSFFRGFCKHGVPSVAASLDSEDQQSSRWTPLYDKSNPNRAWNIHALKGLFEAYLSLSARSRAKFQSHEKVENLGMLSASSRSDLDEMDAWLDLFPDEEVKAVRKSVLSLERPPNDQLNMCRAPSNNQLFNILTALRRTSNDEATWVLQQWQRIVDKFSVAEDDRIRYVDGKQVNEEGWYDFKVNNRLKGIIAELQDGQ